MVRSSSRYGPVAATGSVRICWAAGAASGGRVVAAEAFCQGSSIAVTASKRTTLFFTLWAFHKGTIARDRSPQMGAEGMDGNAAPVESRSVSRGTADGVAHRTAGRQAYA